MAGLCECEVPAGNKENNGVTLVMPVQVKEAKCKRIIEPQQAQKTPYAKVECGRRGKSGMLICCCLVDRSSGSKVLVLLLFIKSELNPMRNKVGTKVGVCA